MNVALRPTTPDDGDFLYRVYASTREAELVLVDWNENQKAAFLRQQFDAQSRYYGEHYPEGAFDVILSGGRPVGRLYVARLPEEIRIVDIALLPEYRNGKIGTELIGNLIHESEETGKTLSVHVERFNPALRLYERLGFYKVADKGVYFLMRRAPGAR